MGIFCLSFPFLAFSQTLPCTIPLASVSSTGAICPNETATLTASGGSHYLWNTNDTTAVISVTPSVSTTYSVTITDENGCTAVLYPTIEVKTAPNPPFSVHFVDCGSTRPKAHAIGYGFDKTYEWHTKADRTGDVIPDTLVIDGGVTTGYTSLLKNNVFNFGTTVLDTSYYVFEKGTNGCYSAATEVPITVYPLPQMPDIISPTLGCGDSVNITANGYGNTVEWRTSFNSLAGTTLASGDIFTAKSTQSIYVTAVHEWFFPAYTNPFRCYGGATPINIILNPVPPAPSVSDIHLNLGDAPQPIFTQENYRWYTASENYQHFPAYIINTDVPFSQTFFISQIENGCESTEKSTLIATVSDVPSPPQVTDTLYFCRNSIPQTLTAIGTNLTWYDANFLPLSSVPTPSTADVDTVQFFVSQTLNSVESNKKSITVIISAQPISPFPIEVQPTCLVPTGTITLIAQEPVEYSFDGGETYQASATKSGLEARQYITRVKRISDGCTSFVSSAYIYPLQIPVVNLVSVKQPTCQDNSDYITVNSTALNYIYSIDSGATYQTDNIFFNLVGGTYQLRIKDTATQCVSAVRAEVINHLLTIPETPVATVTQPTCTNPIGSIFITNPSSGVAYSFDNDTTYQASPIKSGLTEGIYIIVVKDSLSGCISQPNDVYITYVPALTTTYNISTPDSTICKGETIKLTVTPACPACTYAWSNGKTSASIFVTPSVSTAYTVTITQNSCITSTFKTITLNAKPPKPNVVVVQPTCLSGGSIVISNLPIGAFSRLNNQAWTQGKSVYNNLNIGEYEVQIRRNGCESEKETVLMVPAFAFDPSKCYKIINKNSGKLLDVFEKRMTNNVPLIQYVSTNGDNQKWQFSTLPNGFLKIKAQHSQKFMSCNVIANGANVVQFDYIAGGQKDWKIECLGNGEYRILHKYSNKYLSVENNANANKAKIEIRNWQNNDAQKWMIVEVPCTTGTNLRQADLFAAHATPEPQYVKLVWYSNTGDKTDYYTVQKLNPQTEQFLDIQTIKNTYFDDDTHTFSHFDAQPTEGVNIYRIKAVYHDGQMGYSEHMSVTFGNIKQVRLFPNPATEYIDIQLPEMPKGTVILTLHNAFGNPLKTQTYEGSQSLHFDLGDMPNGVYQMHINQKGKRSRVEQIIILK
jgi:hypothetical protein